MRRRPGLSEALAVPASWSSQKKAAPARPAQLSKWWQRGWDGVIDSTKPEIVDARTGPRLASGTQ
jgi:hypothetical protein